jgi:hypothetical protein
MDDFLDAVRGVCEDGRRRQSPASDGLREIACALDALDTPRPCEAEDLPVVRAHLGRSLSLASDPVAGRLADAMRANAAAIPWRAPQAYAGDPRIADFLRSYAVAPIVGPDRYGSRCPYYSDRVMVGVTLQGPGLHYPAHAHTAVEIYYLIGGTVDWQQGDGLWRRLGPGDFVLHQSEEPHAMRTLGDPLLALFAWVSDLDSEPRIVDPPGEPQSV